MVLKHELLQLSECELFGGDVAVTYFPHAVGGAETLSLSLVPPRFEQVLEHRRLPPFGHHLHGGAGRVVFGFDKTLTEKRRGISQHHL